MTEWKKEIEEYLNSLATKGNIPYFPLLDSILQECRDLNGGIALGINYEKWQIGEEREIQSVYQSLIFELGRALKSRNIIIVTKIWRAVCMVYQCYTAVKRIKSGNKWFGSISTILMMEEPFPIDNPIMAEQNAFLADIAREKDITVSTLITLMSLIDDWKYGPYDTIDLILAMTRAKRLDGNKHDKQKSFRLDDCWDYFEKNCQSQKNIVAYYEAFMTIQLMARDILLEMEEKKIAVNPYNLLLQLKSRPYKLKKMPYQRYETNAFISLDKIRQLCGVCMKTTVTKLMEMSREV